MNTRTYSHHHGEHSVPESVVAPIQKFLANTNFDFEEQSAPTLRKLVLSFLLRHGWSGETKIAAGTDLTVTSMKQSVALALQTGNMSRFYADLLKLQYLYIQNRAEGALYLLPTKEAAKSLGSNIANFERLVEELKMFRHIVTIPILVIGIEGRRI